MKKLLLSLFLSVFCLTSIAIAAEFSADMVIETPFGPQSGKIYHKNSDISRTDLNNMINIMKHPYVYQIFVETKKYVVTDLDQLAKENPAANIRDFNEFVKENNFKKVGSATLQGYKCDIFEGVLIISAEPGGETMSVPMKLWYSKKLDYPIRTESSLPPPIGGKSVSFLENIRTGRQDASLFEIPAGYKEVESVSEAMGYGSMPSMPEGSGPMPSADEMPSPEEMEEIMKMMQEIMKQQSPQ